MHFNSFWPCLVFVFMCKRFVYSLYKPQWVCFMCLSNLEVLGKISFWENFSKGKPQTSHVPTLRSGYQLRRAHPTAHGFGGLGGRYFPPGGRDSLNRLQIPEFARETDFHITLWALTILSYSKSLSHYVIPFPFFNTIHVIRD